MLKRREKRENGKQGTGDKRQETARPTERRMAQGPVVRAGTQETGDRKRETGAISGPLFSDLCLQTSVSLPSSFHPLPSTFYPLSSHVPEL